MTSEWESLEEYESENGGEPSRASVKSFWIACAGLAVIAHVACILFAATKKIDDSLLSFFSIPYGPIQSMLAI